MSNDQLLEYYRRFDNLSEQAEEIAEDIKDLFVEIENAGFDKAITKKAFSLKRDDKIKTFTDSTTEVELVLTNMGEKLDA